MDNPLAEDLDNILERTRDLWEELRGERIFITGGTGFFGCWLLESFAWANEKLKLGAKATVLSRNPDAFRNKAPHIYDNSCIELHRGNLLNFTFPDGTFTYAIHAALYDAPTRERLHRSQVCCGLINGTQYVLDFCRQVGIRKFLLISTGVASGNPASPNAGMMETDTAKFDPMCSSDLYPNTRKMMENLCAAAASERNCEMKIARCFSFIGPYLSLNGRFAVADFISDALSDQTISVNGDGQALRSYMYTADLATWLWTVLFKGKSSQPYNVGSDIPCTILQIAELIRKVSGSRNPVYVAGLESRGVAPNYYVPNTARARLELGLEQSISLENAVKKTLQWHSKQFGKKGVAHA